MTDTFKIFQVDTEEAFQIIASGNEPHSHEFEELIIGTAGQLEHFIDFKTTLLNAPFISFITRGKVHRIQPLLKDGVCKIWAVRFKSEFIPETTFQLYSLYHDNASLELSSGSCFGRLDSLCTMMDEEMKQFILDDNHQALIEYEKQGKPFELAIPTPEHYLPLLYALAVKEKKDDLFLFNDKPVAGSLTMTSVLIG